jgi:hypothetical protein
LLPEPEGARSRARERATRSRPSSPLLSALWGLLRRHRPAFRQERPFLRTQALVFGQLFSFARRTVTQSLVALGLTDHDWSAFYRLFSEPRLDYEALTGCFFRETLPHVPEDEPYVAVVDGVQVPRHSHRMPGTSWLKHPKTPPFSPGPHRAQRFLHLATLLPRNGDGYTRALPLRWEPSFPEKPVLPEGTEPLKQWEAALCAVRWLRTRLDEASREAQRLLVLGDGDFSAAKLRALLPEGVVLLTRCARNRSLYALPGPEEKRRGRPRLYGEKARRPHEWLAERAGWRRAELPVRGGRIPARYRVEGPYVLERAPHRPVFLLVVRGVDRRASRRKHREPAFWLVSAAREGDRWALPFPAAQLLGWAWQRWEVEVAHREMKTGFGLGEVQCWSENAAILAVRWQAWAYGVLVLAGYRARGGLGADRSDRRDGGGAAPRDGRSGLCGGATAPSCGARRSLGPSSPRPGKGGPKKKPCWQAWATP